MATKTKVDNMSLWDKVKETNPKHTKEIKLGKLTLTTINAQHQKENATREFGIYGETWGIKEINYEFLKDLEPYKETLALCKATFFHPTGEFKISSAIKVVVYNSKYKTYRLDDEFAKKVETDIITKALSHLGFNADIFLGKFDDNKYVNNITEKFAETNAPPPAAAKKPAAKKLKAMSEKVHSMGMAAIESGDAERIKQLKLYLEGIEEGDKKKEMLDLINKK